MIIYYIDYLDLVALSNHKTYLEGLPERIESFKINFDLVLPKDVGTYIEPKLKHVTDRAKSVSNLWPENLNSLRDLHRDFAHFLTEVQLFASQLSTYEAQQAGKAKEQWLLNLPLHSAPFALQGKLGVVQESTAMDLINQIRQRHLMFESEFASLALKNETIRMNVCDIIPRFIDFMNVSIIEHSLKYKNKKPPGFISLEDQLTTALLRVQWSESQYRNTMQATSNMGTYCLHMRNMLNHASRDLLGIDPQTTVHKVRRKVDLMNAQLQVLKAHSDSVRTLLQFRI